MNQRSLCVIGALLAALALPASALAKGASAARIDGPGLKSPLRLSGDGESQASALGRLSNVTGFFPSVFGQRPDPMQHSRPTGTLGPRYTITWIMPGPNGTQGSVRQDVYPYAKPSPLTYTQPGQFVWGRPTNAPAQKTPPAWHPGMTAEQYYKLLGLSTAQALSPGPQGSPSPTTIGGWYAVEASLRGALLKQLHLPAKASSSGSSAVLSAGVWAAIAGGGMLALLGPLFVARKRKRPRLA